MVQLKLVFDYDALYSSVGFNSCMVQLKYQYKADRADFDRVLIPVWCN